MEQYTYTADAHFGFYACTQCPEVLVFGLAATKRRVEADLEEHQETHQ